MAHLLKDLFFSASYESNVSCVAGRDGGVYDGYDGVRGVGPRIPLAVSFRCISSCFAFRFLSSVASSSLFYVVLAMVSDCG